MNKKELEKLKNRLIIRSDYCLSRFQHLEPSSNSLFILGSLDYCMIALKKENLDDLVKKYHLLSVIARYIDNFKELPDIPLERLKEEFEQVQKLCSEYDLLSMLYDENLDLSELLDK